ncbi:hypothetical protein [Microbispora triticiradicis]|uniref:hypothetical protein n=1 Tax=Microbispora triticiradicis TaxID=2200763 RepID=UPI001AD6CB61|nr:hypothetical protein [Microbispora triticiradicis]MBO4271334.1 hypothetical protein [Microbispora triticiradicis]
MPKDDDQDPPPPPAVCGGCMGAMGEWVNRNGNSPAQMVWVPCKTCNGTGRT